MYYWNDSIMYRLAEDSLELLGLIKSLFFLSLLNWACRSSIRNIRILWSALQILLKRFDAIHIVRKFSKNKWTPYFQDIIRDFSLQILLIWTTAYFVDHQMSYWNDSLICSLWEDLRELAGLMKSLNLILSMLEWAWARIFWSALNVLLERFDAGHVVRKFSKNRRTPPDIQDNSGFDVLVDRMFSRNKWMPPYFQDNIWAFDKFVDPQGLKVRNSLRAFFLLNAQRPSRS